MKFIASSGSALKPIYKIKGHIVNHVKDKNKKYFVSAEFTNELYTEDFWINLRHLAKSNNKFIELYV